MYDAVGHGRDDDGRAELERSLAYEPGVRERIYRAAKRHPTVAYFGAVVVLRMRRSETPNDE